MKTLIALLAIIVMLPIAAEAKKRPHVIINKPAQLPVVSPVPMAMVPPVLILFDIARRTSCDPNIAVSTGKGDPGFDPDGPKYGNFITPAIYSRCQGRPQPR